MNSLEANLDYVIVPTTRHNYDKKCKIKFKRSPKKSDFDLMKCLCNGLLIFDNEH